MTIRKISIWTLFDILFSIGFGISLHSVANELYYKGGYANIINLEGEYFGLAIMLITYILLRHLMNNN